MGVPTHFLESEMVRKSPTLLVSTRIDYPKSDQSPKRNSAIEDRNSQTKLEIGTLSRVRELRGELAVPPL